MIPGILVALVLAAAEPVLVEVKLPAHFDPYSSEAKLQYERAARVASAAPKPAEFFGYQWRLPAVAAELRLMNGSSEGKQIYIGFLKTKYGYQIAEVDRVYGLDAQSFTELQESPMRSRGNAADDTEFDRDIHREMGAAIRAALERCDATHAERGLVLERALH